MLFQQEMRLPIHNDVGPKSSMSDCEKHDVSHVCYVLIVLCVYVFEVMCVIHVVVNNNLFSVCIQDSEKTPTPPDTQLDESTTSRDTDALIEALLAVRKQAFSKAEENITAAQRKQKEEYDRKHQPKVLKVGTEVLLENTMQKQRKGGKLEPLWLGPYTIHRKGLYELSNQAGMVLKKKANIARLKEYVKRAQDVSH